MGERCSIPPLGWSCSRKPGHKGPCAASQEEALPYEWSQIDQLRAADIMAERDRAGFTYDRKDFLHTISFSQMRERQLREALTKLQNKERDIAALKMSDNSNREECQNWAAKYAAAKAELVAPKTAIKVSAEPAKEFVDDKWKLIYCTASVHPEWPNILNGSQIVTLIDELRAAKAEKVEESSADFHLDKWHLMFDVKKDEYTDEGQDYYVASEVEAAVGTAMNMLEVFETEGGLDCPVVDADCGRCTSCRLKLAYRELKKRSVGGVK